MVAFARSLQVGPVGWVSLTLALSVACATAEEPDEGGPSQPGAGTASSAGGGGASSGGSGTGTAGTLTGTSGTGTGTAGTGTGATSSVGGTGAGSGGTPTGAAGTPAAGGSASGTCPPYTGTVAADSAIFMGGFGKSTTGDWSGYGFTFTYGTATVTPGKGTSCFAGAKFCASGNVPASDAAGAALGWNISQAMGSSAATKVAITTPIKLTYKGVTEGMRVQLSASADSSYCYTLTAAEASAGTATIPYASFKTACWGTEGLAYDGVVAIESIQLLVPGATGGAAKPFDFCVLDIEPG